MPDVTMAPLARSSRAIARSKLEHELEHELMVNIA
jgi:hypothetical protein